MPWMCRGKKGFLRCVERGLEGVVRGKCGLEERALFGMAVGVGCGLEWRWMDGGGGEGFVDDVESELMVER